MVDVVGDDRAAAGDFVADELRGDVVGDARAEILAVADEGFLGLRATEIFADRDIFHFGGDDAAARVMHLADVVAGFGAQGALDDMRELRNAGGAIRAGQAVILGAEFARVVRFDIAACEDPVAAQRREAGLDVDARLGIGVRAAGVVDAQGWLAAAWFEQDFAHRHACAGDVGRHHVDLAAAADCAGGDADFRAGWDICHAFRSKCRSGGHGFRTRKPLPPSARANGIRLIRVAGSCLPLSCGSAAPRGMASV